MTTVADVLRLHVHYMAWASARVLDAAAALAEDELTRDFGTAHHSLLGTLVHVFEAERIWLNRLQQGGSGQKPRAEPPGLEALREACPRLHQEWRDWAAALDTEGADATVAYQDLRGNPWRTPVWQVVLHVVNHGTHHRGQVAGFLRAMGHAPPPMDLIVYCRQL